MVSREMRFGLVKLREDDCRDCIVAASSPLTVLSISVVPEVELERRDLSLFFTFVPLQIVFAWNLQEIWHAENSTFLYSLSCVVDASHLYLL